MTTSYARYTLLPLSFDKHQLYTQRLTDEEVVDKDDEK